MVITRTVKIEKQTEYISSIIARKSCLKVSVVLSLIRYNLHETYTLNT